MSTGISFIISGICISLLINIVYFSKERISSYETKIYGYLTFANLVGLLIEYGCSILVPLDYVSITFKNFFVKSYLIYLVGWSILFFYYVIIGNKENYFEIRSKLQKITTILFAIMSLSLIILPVEHIFNNNDIYSVGLAVDATYIYTGMAIVAMIIVLVTNVKNIRSKKNLPLLAFVLLGSLVALIQAKNPELLMVSAMEAYVILIMYFTIENPDVKLIKELNIARNQAEKANNAKSEFLSNMSHEIRTPLNAIVGFSQALYESEIPDTAKDEVNDIIMASENLLEIVNGILDISKIEANKLEIINKEYNFSKIIDEIISLIKGRLGDKPLEFRASIDESIPLVLYGDSTRLKQIIINLLTNAVKYTKEGYISFVINSVIKDDVCRLIIMVEDTGIGIEKHKIDKLFNKFERMGIEGRTTIEGTGLGLAITKKLIELMNGKIVVQSVYGEGSKFTVAIDQKIVLKPSIELINDKRTKNINDFDISNKKILVVDDNKLNLKVATRILKNYNVVVDTVLSGQECLDEIESGNKYDLILLDDMMPKMSGGETLKKLKLMNDFDTPVVVFTANAITGMKEKYLQEGFSGYLSKPVQKSDLNEILKEFLV